MSIEGQGHFFTIYFSGFICFVLYLCRPRYQVSVYRTIGPLVVYFYGLCILISFSLLTITVRGVSNKLCLLPFFHLLQNLCVCAFELCLVLHMEKGDFVMTQLIFIFDFSRNSFQT